MSNSSKMKKSAKLKYGSTKPNRVSYRGSKIVSLIKKRQKVSNHSPSQNNALKRKIGAKFENEEVKKLLEKLKTIPSEILDINAIIEGLAENGLRYGQIIETAFGHEYSACLSNKEVKERLLDVFYGHEKNK